MSISQVIAVVVLSGFVLLWAVFASLLRDVAYYLQQEELLEKTLMIASTNGSRTSLYESLRNTGASTLLENLQSQLKQREGEVHQLQSEITELERTRESMARELVNLTNKNEDLEEKLREMSIFKSKFIVSGPICWRLLLELLEYTLLDDVVVDRTVEVILDKNRLALKIWKGFYFFRRIFLWQGNQLFSWGVGARQVTSWNGGCYLAKY